LTIERSTNPKTPEISRRYCSQKKFQLLTDKKVTDGEQFIMLSGMWLRLAMGDTVGRHRRSTTFDYAADSALTWLFAGLALIAVVAGVIAQMGV
jgi:hypothetical protein